MGNTIRSRINYIVDKYKNYTAIINGEEVLTYEKLNEEKELLSSNLLKYGIKAQDRVGILCSEKRNWITSMLGVLNIGAVYIPLDINNSEEYIEKLAQNVGMKLILTDKDIDFSFVDTKNILNLESIEDDYEVQEFKEDSLAYIMFTSGTTGVPKGVGVTHGNIINLTVDSNYVKLDSNVRMLQTGAPTFDASTFDVWGTLLNGGTLILIEGKRVTDLKYLESVINKHEVTTMWLTSPLFSIAAEKNPKGFKGVKELIVGGDVVNPDHVDKVLDVCDGITIFNGYGPTECTTFSTVYKISDKNNGQVIPIGKPIKNTFVYILDEDFNIVEDGEIGELFIGGKGVSKGYIENEELNNERFIDNPFGEGKLYKTGDLVKADNDGNVYFLGRKDRQVKIRGYRIELDAVEVLLKKINHIDKAVTCAVTNMQGGKEICTCVTLNDGIELTEGEIRKEFSEVAPSHIVLSQIKILESLPINKNGKIDYKQIKELFESKSTDEDEEACEFETKEEALIADIIRKRTGFKIDDVSISFFELGVDSLMAVYLASDISEEFKVEINPMDILMNATIGELVEFINLQPKEIIETSNKSFSLKKKLPILNQQKPIFIDFSVNPDSVKYNIPLLSKLPSEIDIDLLIESIHKLVSRHDALKVKFSMEGLDMFQTIEDDIEFKIERINGTPDLDKLIRPFNLKEELPFRFSIIENGKDKWLFMDYHHIIVDGFSLKLIIKELNNFYYKGNNKELISNYANLVEEALNSYENNKENCNKYYEEYFEGFNEMDELPLDKVQKGNSYRKNSCYKFKIDKDITSRFKKWCQKINITTFEGLMIGYTGFLHTITGSSDVVFATPSRNYSDEKSDEIISMLTNTVWIYSNIKDDEKISSYITRFVHDLREVQKYKDVSVDFIYNLRNKNNSQKSNLTDTLIAYHSWNDINTELFGEAVKAKPISPRDGMFLLNMQIFDDESTLDIEWEYMEDAFELDTIVSLGEMFLFTIECLIENNLDEYSSINELVISNM
ncbi:amino acid adenylation domain-containing protein [Clostridium sp. DSM 8431]|uniref:non-ribosomal peptide synthetase n=1 Tax=Clostridium sp. DSM 8431 TaxID=1761781 RepID=UPI0008E0A802|nr:non-ribosomal peptide synthetase [Clostridium sp. DSM 8431]SFU37448.1 amino acid adenylation domain-containing protein [Clostridium sp. DSM 8431]